MEEIQKGSTSMWKAFGTLICGLLLILLTSMITLHMSHKIYTRQCHSSQSIQFSEEPEWDESVRLEIPEKKMTVINTVKRCYIRPHTQGKVLSVVHEPLAEEVLQEIAGEDAIEFCAGQPTYLLVDATKPSRSKRQAPKNIIDGEDQGGRGQGLDIPYNQRNPRCMDYVLDCAESGAIGQTQKCYTWINGILEMEQTCLENNKFQVLMRKPKGRILKIMQKQAIICIKRRREGLRC